MVVKWRKAGGIDTTTHTSQRPCKMIGCGSFAVAKAIELFVMVTQKDTVR